MSAGDAREPGKHCTMLHVFVTGKETCRAGGVRTLRAMDGGGVRDRLTGYGSVVLAVFLLTTVGAGAQQAGAQQSQAPSKQSPPSESQPVPLTAPGVTPPKLQEGQTTVIVDQPLTKAQEKQLLADADEIFHFVSKDTGLPIQKSVKKVFITRDKVNSELRKKFDEDKSNKRMERSELVLKKFGLLDHDFQLRPFLLSLLTEQIAGFYDNKTKTMNLLDWVPIDQQKPVMAHELTHALQDQKVGLKNWEDLEPDSVAKNVEDDAKHIQTDETDTAREAVLEGQAMVSFADYMLKPTGKTLRDVPQVGEQLQAGAGDMSDSPVLARAPLILQESLLFPYTQGLAFEQAVLLKAGTEKAFTGVLDAPPNTSAEVMHPDDYMARKPEPVLALPDIHPTLETAGYEPYDVGGDGRAGCSDDGGAVWRQAAGRGAESAVGRRRVLRRAAEECERCGQGDDEVDCDSIPVAVEESGCGAELLPCVRAAVAKTV